MAPPPVAAGSTPASTRGRTRPTSGSRMGAMDAFGAAGVDRPQSALSESGKEPGRESDGAPGQSLRALARRALSPRADDVSADRAPHGRRDVAHAAAPRRAAAGALRRDLAG